MFSAEREVIYSSGKAHEGISACLLHRLWKRCRKILSGYTQAVTETVHDKEGVTFKRKFSPEKIRIAAKRIDMRALYRRHTGMANRIGWKTFFMERQ